MLGVIYKTLRINGLGTLIDKFIVTPAARDESLDSICSDLKNTVIKEQSSVLIKCQGKMWEEVGRRENCGEC